MLRCRQVLALAIMYAVLQENTAVFYFICQSFPVSDTTCSGTPLPETNIYITDNDLTKFAGGDKSTSTCFPSKTYRFYSLWCNTSTNTFGAQQFTSADCSDEAWNGNPSEVNGRGGRSVALFLKGDCYFDTYSSNSIKYLGCTEDIGMIPYGYKRWIP